MPGVRLLSLMNNQKPIFPLVVIAIYMLAVFVCIFLAFDFEGAINTLWTGALIVLTLPWSLVSILFAWALIHGAGLEFFAVIYLLFASFNSLIFFWLCSRFRKNSEGVQP